MKDFIFSYPTKVYFGKGACKKALDTELKNVGQNIMLAYGGGSIKKNGIYDEIMTLLSLANKKVVEFSGIMSNPTYKKVQEGAKIAKENNVDFILAVGGGSVIDSSKAIGYGVVNGGDVWDFYDRKRTPQSCMPIGCVLTIAAAGSEMSNSSVITKEEGLIKRGCNSDVCRAKFAILNPELTMTLPPYQTSSGCADIMMHTMERYFNQSENMDITDSIAEGLMKTVKKHAVILMTEPDNYESRAEVMWASSLSHNGITGCGTDGGDWATHKMEHELGGMFDCAHGAGLAAIWASWARYVYKANINRWLQYASNVWGLDIDFEHPEKTIETAIDMQEQYYASIGMPIGLKELGVKEEDLAKLALDCSRNKTRSLIGYKPLAYEDILVIYQMAYERG